MTKKKQKKQDVPDYITREQMATIIEGYDGVIMPMIKTLAGQINRLEKDVTGLCGARAGLVEECANMHDRVYGLEKNIESIKERHNLK